MTSVLEIAEIRQRVSPLSVAEYHRLGEFNENGRRTELIRGIVIEKMSKSPTHRKLIERLRRILSAQVEPQWVVFQEGPITTPDSEPEPDLAILTGPLERYDRQHPTTAELVIEIAVSSLETDRAKASIYAAAGVKEYWIVCPEQKLVEVFRQPTAQGYAETLVVSAPGLLECATLPGVQLDLGAVLG